MGSVHYKRNIRNNRIKCRRKGGGPKPREGRGADAGGVRDSDEVANSLCGAIHLFNRREGKAAFVEAANLRTRPGDERGRRPSPRSAATLAPPHRPSRRMGIDREPRGADDRDHQDEDATAGLRQRRTDRAGLRAVSVASWARSLLEHRRLFSRNTEGMPLH